MYTKVLFIVTEKHMLTNMKHMLDEIQRYPVTTHVYVSPFKSIPFVDRLKYGKKYLRLLKQDFREKVPSEYFINTLIIYSNAEGFWISNKDNWSSLFIHCTEVFLQHGIMPISIGYCHLRGLLNFCSSLLMGYNIIGKGFGGVKADYMVVYGSTYKNFLVDKKGWKDGQILVSGCVFKSSHIDSSFDCKKPISKSCLLLLQNLSAFYISEQRFVSYCRKILEDLSFKYDKIIVRKHPKMSIEYDSIWKGLKNVCISQSSLRTDILSVEHVFSFFSTALIDAYLLNRKVIAIKLPEIPINVYTSFNRVIHVDDLKEYLLTQIDIDKMANINNLYFDTKTSTNDILKELLCKSKFCI